MTRRRIAIILALLGMLSAVAALDLRTAGFLPAGTEITELRTANARHYSNGDGSIRAVLEAKTDPETDASQMLNASYSGYSELMYVYGSLYTAVRYSHNYAYVGYYGTYYPDGYILERAYAQWDISSIPDSSTVNSMRCAIYCSGTTSTIDSLKLFHMRLQPSLITDAVALYNDAGDGLVYGRYPISGSGTWYDTALTVSACTTLQRFLFVHRDTNWFAIGYSGYPTINGYNTWERQFNGDNLGNPPRLTVDYNPPNAGDVGVTRIFTRRDTVDSAGTFAPVCSVYNYGATAQTYKVRLRIGPGGALGIDSAQVTGHAPGTRLYVTFPTRTANWPRGYQLVTCSTELAGDGNTGNDRKRDSTWVRVTDIGVTRIEVPVGTVDSGVSIDPVCWIRNFGNRTIGSPGCTVHFRCGAFYDQIRIVASLAPNESVRVQAYNPSSVWPRGFQIFTCSTRLWADIRPDNDRVSSTFFARVLDAAPTSLIPSGTVDSGAAVPVRATVKNNGNSNIVLTVTVDINDGYHQVGFGTVSAGAETLFVFPDWSPVMRGPRIVSCSTNLLGDVIPTNDKLVNEVTVDVRDAAVRAIVVPGDTVNPSFLQPMAWVRNYGTRREPLAVHFAINSSPPYEATQFLAAGLPPGVDTLIQFTTWSAALGSYVARCSVQLPFDQHPENDTTSKAFVVVPPRLVDVGVSALVAPLGVYDTVDTITPSATFENYGNVPTGFMAWLTIQDSGGVPVYLDTWRIPLLMPSATVTPVGRPWPPVHVPGHYTARCSLACAGDIVPNNDTASRLFLIQGRARRPGIPGWYRMAEVPIGNKNKKVKDGAGLAYARDYGAEFIYALKGNNTCEFYRYNIETNTWAARESIPAYGRLNKKKAVKKGGALCAEDRATGAPVLYAVKGNNCLEFWRYEPYAADAYPWQQLPDVPAGARAIKEGASLATVKLGETTFVYLLKGSGTYEFYRCNAENGLWQTLTNAPNGPSGKTFKNGSRITYAPDQRTIYALKGSYNECFAYSLDLNSWTTLASVPMSGTGGRKKVKDGAGLAWLDRTLYVLKGGNTREFWQFRLDTARWEEKENIGLGDGKKVKGGGNLVSDGTVLWALKGNNTTEFWLYVPWPTNFGPGTEPPAHTMSQPAVRTSEFALRACPNPFSGMTTISYSLPSAGPMSLKLYDVTGALVATLFEGRRPAGSSALSVSRSALSAGIYLLKLTTDNTTLTTKLIVE